MPIRLREDRIDPARRNAYAEVIEHLWATRLRLRSTTFGMPLDAMATNIARLRAGLPIVDSGEMLWQVGDPPSVLHEPHVVLEHSGTINVADELRGDDGRLIDYVRRADGSRVGYNAIGAPRAPDELRAQAEFWRAIERQWDDGPDDHPDA